VEKEKIRLLNEIKEILKPNGIICINDFLLNNDERNIKIIELSKRAIASHHNMGGSRRLAHPTSGFLFGLVPPYETAPSNSGRAS
jgi:hypothetical protein